MRQVSILLCHTDTPFCHTERQRSIHKFKAWIFRFLTKAQNDKMVWDFSLAKLTQNDKILVILSDSEVSIKFKACFKFLWIFLLRLRLATRWVATLKMTTDKVFSYHLTSRAPKKHLPKRKPLSHDYPPPTKHTTSASSPL